MNKKRLLTFFLLLVAASIGTANLQAATLHAILVCDTHADAIERSVEEDFQHIKKEISLICKATKLKKNVKTFTGRKVDSGFLKAIDSLKVRPEDVIVFYYSGHGIRFNSQEDPWPVFDFEYEWNSVSQYTVTQKILAKHPRLILSITDCCNSFANKAFMLTERKISSFAKENYKTLFLYSEGTYMATAASPGESSLGLNGPDKEAGIPAGGYYTNALLEVLHDEVDKAGLISWDLVFTLAGQKTVEYQSSDPYDPFVYHHPFFQHFPN